MNLHLADADVQKFINDHLGDDIARISLSKSPFPNVSSRELAEQIDGKKRSEKKLPLWFNTPGVIYPPKLSIEQCSSEITGLYKSNLLSGTSLIDLTGGFGVDSLYFSKKAEQVWSCERDAGLSEIAAYNAQILNSRNILFLNTDGLEYLMSSGRTYGTAFIDPSRRVKTNKVFMLKDCEPDVVDNLNLLKANSQRIIIKTSPLLDLQAGLKELQQVNQVHVVSVKNDCKELLWIIDKEPVEEPEIVCAVLSAEHEAKFSFKPSEEKHAASGPYSDPEAYLYEPDVALLKAGCFKLIALRFGISKLSTSTHLYTSRVRKRFAGRTFEIVQCFDYKEFIKNNSIKKANVVTRNFPNTPEALKKKHKITDGGEDYLFFTTGSKKQLLVIQAKRLK